mgnify:CR=1 FL=1
MCKKYTYNILTTLTFLVAKSNPKGKEVIIELLLRISLVKVEIFFALI